jgi:predicted nucleic acid-binding protein
LIVLDTDVLSEPLKTDPEEAVLRWIATGDDMATTAVTVAELLTGARRLPPGRRRDDLLVGIERVLGAFPASVLPYDEAAARRYAEMQEPRRSAGVPLSVEDGMIVAICASRSLALATRNIKDFEGLGMSLINPWNAHL